MMMEKRRERDLPVSQQQTLGTLCIDPYGADERTEKRKIGQA
jgi:hypothetical protein